MKREILHKILIEEYLRIVEFRLEDLSPEIISKLEKIKDPKYKAQFLASLAVHLDIPFVDLMTIVKKMYQDKENLDNFN